VDLSNTYLNWAKRNFDLNRIATENHEFIQADCLQWLEQQATIRYDVIFLDPPTFSNSKRMQEVWDIQRQHAAVIHHCMARLERDGLLIFSTNYRKFKLAADITEKYAVTDISAKTLPADFARNPKIHRCWEIRRQP
jgi:23S rRNA (guanine2445-N2)-methyltransferase / 23S rRNA (guanine2069-N7)-methyltransferase